MQQEMPDWGCSSQVERLPSTCEALASALSVSSPLPVSSETVTKHQTTQLCWPSMPRSPPGWDYRYAPSRLAITWLSHVRVKYFVKRRGGELTQQNKVKQVQNRKILSQVQLLLSLPPECLFPRDAVSEREINHHYGLWKYKQTKYLNWIYINLDYTCQIKHNSV